MKSNQLINWSLYFALIFSLGLFTDTSSAQQKTYQNDPKHEDVTMTIDNKTNSENFEEIADMLSDYGVTANFSKIERNDQDELTGLKIELQTTNGQRTSSQISSNLPIDKISFGLRRGQLFIDQGASGPSALAFRQSFGQSPSGIAGDSIFASMLEQMKFFSFDELFGQDGDSFNFSKDSMAIDKFQNKFYGFFKDPNAQSDVFSWMQDPYSKTDRTYRFIDDPDKEKLIVIDGEPSDFKTLDQLARTKQLDKVDILKPETATSIYGAKAKDGAIIATTKGQ